MLTSAYGRKPPVAWSEVEWRLLTRSSRSRNRESKVNRAIKKTLYALLMVPTIGVSVWAGPSADDFRYFLQTADCTFLEADHAIDLWVFDMKFPLSTGFYFAGHEVNGVTFRRNFDLGPLEYMEQNPDTPRKYVAGILSAQRASVHYYRVEQREEHADSDYSDYEPLEWNGLSLLYRSTVGGRQIETTVHQVIVRDEAELERLLITATNPARIANIVACAKEID